MTEPTTTLTYTNFINEVGWYLGRTGTSSNWSAAELAQFDSIVQDAVQEFYNAHTWSFLYPATTLVAWTDVATSASNTVTATYASPTFTITSTASEFYPTMVGHTLYIYLSGTSVAATAFTITGYTSATVVTATSTHSTAITEGKQYYMTADGNYTMPDNFCGIIGPLTWEEGSDLNYPPIDLGSELRVRTSRQSSSIDGRPLIGAIRSRTFSPTTGQRYELMLYPIPDDDYTLTYRSNTASQDKLSSTNLYPLGGTRHSLTIKAFCLACAESRVNGEIGVKAADKQRLLQQSIMFDANATTPDTLGFDTTYRKHGKYSSWLDTIHRSSDITFNGNSI